MPTDWYSEVSGNAPPPKADWYGELSSQQDGGASPEPFKINAPRITGEAEPKGVLQSLRSAVTGHGRKEYDLPEFDLPFEFSGRQFKTALGLQTTFRPEREVEILRKNYPDLMFTQDKFGNVIVDGSAYGGKQGYLNMPGISLRDLGDIGFQVGAFTPAGKAAGMAVGTAAKLMTAGGASAITQAALDVGNQALGGTKDVQVSNVEPGDVALAGLGGMAGEGLGMLAAKYLPRMQKSPVITDGMREAFRQEAVKAGKDPAMITDDLIASYIEAAKKSTDPATIASTQQADEFKIPYTVGQATKDTKQLQLEDSMRHGALGPKAQDTMATFAEKQQAPAIAAARSRMQADLSGGTPNIEQATGAGGLVREGVKSRAAAADEAIGEAYNQVGDAFMSTKGMKELTNSMLRTSKTAAFETDPRLAPATSSLLDQLDDFSAMLKEGGGKIRPYHIDKLESFRRVLNNKIDTALNATDRRQIIILKQTFDQYLDDAVTKGLMSGDDGAIEALKNARSLRAEYGRLFQNNPIKTRSGMNIQDPVGKVMENLIAADPTDEQVMNYMFGASRLGGKNAGAQIASRLKEVLGEDSKEWAAIREAGFLKLTEPAKGANVTSGQVMNSRLGIELTQNPTLMNTLYSPEEINTMKRLADAIKRAQPDAMNPSKTSYKLSQIAQQMWEGVMASIGYSAGGPAGAIAARQGTKAASGWGAARAAAKATRGVVYPLKSVPLGKFAAPGAVSLNAENKPLTIEINRSANE